MRCGYNAGGIKVRPLLVLLLSFTAVPPYVKNLGKIFQATISLPPTFSLCLDACDANMECL
jgi:hypothetical protein